MIANCWTYVCDENELLKSSTTTRSKNHNFLFLIIETLVNVIKNIRRKGRNSRKDRSKKSRKMRSSNICELWTAPGWQLFHILHEFTSVQNSSFQTLHSAVPLRAVSVCMERHCTNWVDLIAFICTSDTFVAFHQCWDAVMRCLLIVCRPTAATSVSLWVRRWSAEDWTIATPCVSRRDGRGRPYRKQSTELELQCVHWKTLSGRIYT